MAVPVFAATSRACGWKNFLHLASHKADAKFVEVAARHLAALFENNWGLGLLEYGLIPQDRSIVVRGSSARQGPCTGGHSMHCA
jgi:hypothetical protein